MNFRSTFIAMLSVLATGVSACDFDNGSSKPPSPGPPPTTGPTGAPGQAQFRAVAGSPDAGSVDVYIYSAGTSLPSSPTVANLRYRAISNYVNVASGDYDIDVFPQGQRSNGIVPTQLITINSGQQATAALAGEVASRSVDVATFIEPAETQGQSALIIHHAAPGLATSVVPVDPVGVAYYDASVAGGGNPSNGNVPVAAITRQLVAFSYQPGAAGASGPAASGQLVGGEFFLSPLPATLPLAIGFAAGAPSSDGTPLGSIVASALLTQLATNTTLPNATLQNDTSERLPAGAHLSIFVVDNSAAANGATPAPVTLIGALDP